MRKWNSVYATWPDKGAADPMTVKLMLNIALLIWAWSNTFWKGYILFSAIL